MRTIDPKTLNGIIESCRYGHCVDVDLLIERINESAIDKAVGRINHIDDIILTAVSSLKYDGESEPISLSGIARTLNVRVETLSKWRDMGIVGFEPKRMAVVYKDSEVLKIKSVETESNHVEAKLSEVLKCLIRYREWRKPCI